MRAILLCLISLLIGMSNANGQKKILNQIKENKLLADKYTQYRHNGIDTFPQMRVPAELIHGEYRGNIILLQDKLNSLQPSSTTKTSYQFREILQSVNRNIMGIEFYDSLWVTRYYHGELDFYAKRNNEQITRDSLKQRKVDSISLKVLENKKSMVARQTAHEDSVYRHQLDSILERNKRNYKDYSDPSNSSSGARGYLKRYAGTYYILVTGYQASGDSEAYALEEDGTATYIFGYKGGNGKMVTQKKYGTWKASNGKMIVSIQGNTGMIDESFKLVGNTFKCIEEPSRYLQQIKR